MQIATGLLIGAAAWFSVGVVDMAAAHERRSFPHHAVLKDTQRVGYFGGSLITTKWILTAGHMVKRHWVPPAANPNTPLSLRAVLGVTDFTVFATNPTALNWEEVIMVRTPRTLQKMSANFWRDDYGLVKLRLGYVDYVGKVEPIELPGGDDRIGTVLVNEKINVDFITSGTGSDETAIPLANLKLNFGKYRQRPMSECPQEVMPFKDTVLCVEPVEHVDTPCAGDVGSGLIGNPRCRGHNNHLVAIMTAPPGRNSGNCALLQANVVTLVTPAMREWIETIVDIPRNSDANGVSTYQPACSPHWCRTYYCPAQEEAIFGGYVK